MVNHHKGKHNDGFGDTAVGSRLICHHPTCCRVRRGEERVEKNDPGSHEFLSSEFVSYDVVLEVLLIVECWKMHVLFSHIKAAAIIPAWFI